MIMELDTLEIKLSRHAIEQYQARGNGSGGLSYAAAQNQLENQAEDGHLLERRPTYVGSGSEDRKGLKYWALDGNHCLSLVRDGVRCAKGRPVWIARTFLSRLECTSLAIAGGDGGRSGFYARQGG